MDILFLIFSAACLILCAISCFIDEDLVSLFAFLCVAFLSFSIGASLSKPTKETPLKLPQTGEISVFSLNKEK